MESQKKKITYSTMNQQNQSTMKKMKEENDLPPISFQEQPKNTQPEYFMFNFTKGQTVCRMKNYEQIHQSPQPVEKVVELSDETMLEQKQDQQKIERSYSENSMECEGENQQKKMEKMINHKQATLHITQPAVSVINHATLNASKTVNGGLPTAIHQPMKTIQQTPVTNPTKQIVQQTRPQRQIKQQKSKEQIHTSQPAAIYNVVPNAQPTTTIQQSVQQQVQTTIQKPVQSPIQTSQQPIQKEQTVVNSSPRVIQTSAPSTSKTKMTSPQTTTKTQANVITQATKTTKEKKPAKLRIQPTSEKKQRQLIPIKSGKTTDPNMTKRREMMKMLRDIQRMNLYYPMKTVTTPVNEVRTKTFVRDMNEYCYRNDFFRCQESENGEVVVSCDMLGEKRMDIVFDMNEGNYENWNFPKPRLSDGNEVCDKNMMERMKKQPSIEIFMNELFRIATVCCEQY